MRVTVTNLTTSLLSCDVGLLNPGETKSLDMGPIMAYRAAEGMKSLVDAGRISLSVGDESTKIDMLEPAMLAGNQLQAADVTVSSAELLALNATPKTIIPAPAAGTALIFEGAVLYMPYNSAAYVADIGDDLAFKYTNGSGLALGQVEATGFLTATSNQVRWCHKFNAASGDSSITPVAATPIVLQMIGTEVITGNSPLKVRAFYRVVPTVLP